VRVHCDEGVASHIGPEPCAGIREGAGEASVGERVGQPLSPEITFLGSPTRLVTWKAKPVVRNREHHTGPDGVVEPGMLRRSLRGNREISSLATVHRYGWSASGR
jgi:hypothetical protein